jgi:uncharacterized membrane-anchored protein YitT (DUF2179 family)
MSESGLPTGSDNGSTPPQPPNHSLLEDVQALLTGTLFVALAVVLFRQAGMVTGGTAGLAFVAHYALGWPFGAVFFVLNLPFYGLAWKRMGPRFTMKTLLAVGLLALLSEWLPQWLVLERVHPLFAAVGGGLLAGAGFLILFRHQSSLGGLNVLVLWLQEHRGWRAGKVQLVIDLAILLAATPWLDLQHLALSVLGAAALNFSLAVNHKPGRYVAV